MHIGKDLVAAAATPLVLGILAEGESYGYAILQRVERALGRRARVERRHAVPAAAPARAARARRVRVGCLADRAAAQALPAERRRPRRARRAAPAVGGGQPGAAAGVVRSRRRPTRSSPAPAGHDDGRTRDRRSRSRSPRGATYRRRGAQAIAGPTSTSSKDTCATRSTSSRHPASRADEAFLVAVKRIGGLDDLSREFAREHSDRLWKQLVVGERRARRGGRDGLPARRRARGRRRARDQGCPALFGIDVLGRPGVLRCATPACSSCRSSRRTSCVRRGGSRPP